MSAVGAGCSGVFPKNTAEVGACGRASRAGARPGAAQGGNEPLFVLSLITF